MLKRLMALALAGMVSLPMAAMAAPTVEDLEERISDLEDTLETMEENSEKWDMGSRIQLNGDYRFSVYWNQAETPEHWFAGEIAEPFAWFLAAGKSMDRWLASKNYDPSLILNDFMNDFNQDKVDGGNRSLMTEREFASFRAFMDSNDVLNILSPRFVYNLTDEIGLFISPQNMANFFTGERAYIGAPLTMQERLTVMNELQFTTTPAATYKNDSILLNRFRLNLRAKATENLEVKARFVVYKAWGMQNNPVDYYNDPDPMETDSGYSDNYGPYMYSTMDFDGSNTRAPSNNLLKVDRMFANWNNVFDSPVWFSAGRRPTTDGPPAHFKLGADKRMATPMAFMDYPFDGMTFGYAWANPWPGRARFCMGRGFESGPTIDANGVNDVDFAGFAVDVYKKDDAFLYIQSFGAFNMMNVPDNVMFWNPLEVAKKHFNDEAIELGVATTFSEEEVGNLTLDRANLGNIYHTDFVYYNTTGNWDYFLAGGWSRTDPEGYDELGVGLLSQWWDPNVLQERDGFAGYTGVRYSMDDLRLKVGAEFNMGSKYWISFTPGHDDLYASKLAVRGWASEAYLIWDMPAGEVISKFGKAFFRLGWIHYDYDYTGSGFWLGSPINIDDLANDPANAQFNVPVDTADSVYLTYEAWF